MFRMLSRRVENMYARTAGAGSGIFDVINSAKYIEDSWKVSPNVLINGGLRWESFENKTLPAKIS